MDGMKISRLENLRRGVALFNDGEYFLAHEALEDAWRETHGPERQSMQGLVQAAVGMHHFSSGNLVGARGVLARALRNLENCPALYSGVDVAALRPELGAILQCAAAGAVATEPARRFPKMRLVDSR